VRRTLSILIDGMLICCLIGSPDRWDDLPEAVLAQPGLFSNLLTFSAGPRVRLSIFIAGTLAQSWLIFRLFSVLHWHAILYDRDESISVYSAHELHVRGNGRENYES
jgi:hypothetical protein